MSDTARSVARELCTKAELVSSLVDLDAHLDSRPPTFAEVSEQSVSHGASAGAAGAKAEESEERDESGELSDWRNPVIARAVKQCLRQVESEGETETEPESAPAGAQ